MSDCLCFNILSTLASAVIPAGTGSVVVEQFEIGSAVSAALYIPVGTTNPGHPLSILNTPSGIYWAIHADYVTLEAAGAPASVTGDCAFAFQNVLNYFLPSAG
jgi:hypothetical protein